MTTNELREAAQRALTEDEKRELLDWVSACQSAYHIESTPGHRFGGLSGQLQENREALVEFVNELFAARASSAATNEAAGQWLPIETAPKDGTYILLGNETTVSEGGWLSDLDQGAEWEGQTGMAGWWRVNDSGGPPTRWMPLPAAPGSTTASPAPAQPKLKVWFGSMPESNGKRNWTVLLRREDPKGLRGDIGNGICIHRSEYYDQARYSADRMRFLIGERAEHPDILEYPGDTREPPKEPEHG